MEITFKEETDPCVITRLNESVQNYHATTHPDVFLTFDYERLLPSMIEVMSKDNVHVIAAYDGSKAVGYVLLMHNVADNPYQIPNYSVMFVDQMSVDPTYQNQGVGAKMMDYVTTYCKEKEVNRLELTAWSDNMQAKHFYKKLGFGVKMERLEKIL
jgi:ribosomal protein S18 acetylase RimI-like enzyme